MMFTTRVDICREIGEELLSDRFFFCSCFIPILFPFYSRDFGRARGVLFLLQKAPFERVENSGFILVILWEKWGLNRDFSIPRFVVVLAKIMRRRRGEMEK
jgi:hypothetical protein